MFDGETTPPMCGDASTDQYYYTIASTPTLVTWTVTQTDSDYDIFIKDDGSCPSRASYDDRTIGFSGEESLPPTCISSGSSKIFSRKYSGTGYYTISLTKTTKECCTNEETWGSQACLDRYIDGSKPRCDNYICVEPVACTSNNQCVPGKCCTTDSTLPVILRDETGLCKDLGELKQPYLCTN